MKTGLTNVALSKIFNRYKLRTQLLAVFGLAFLFAGLAAVQATRYIESVELKNQIETEAEKLSTLLTNVSSEAVQLRDEKAIHNSLETLTKSYDKIRNATFFDENGDLIANFANGPVAISNPNRNPEQAYEASTGLVHTTTRIETDGKYLGDLSLSWDTSEAQERLQRIQTKIYLTLFVMLGALGIVLGLLINNLVLRPIENIQHHMKRVQKDSNTPHLKLDASPELRVLADRANEFGSLMELRLAREAELAEAAQTKTEFLANMSHELRTPLNGVLGMLTLLQKTDLDPSQKDHLKVATSSGRSLLELINDILDYSKIEAGRMEFESIDFDLYETIEDCCSVQAESAHRKQLELVSLIDDDLPRYLRGDPTRIRQILTNLVSNAIKFTDSGSVAIRVHLLESDSKQYQVQFNVTDTGIGLEQGAIDKVFESFAQADGSTTRKYGGTGLGLAICRQLAEGMGGTIGVESKIGSGSNFWLELPLDLSLANTGSPTPGYRLQDTNLLVVDPNETSTQATASLLSVYEAPFATASSAKKAMELIDRAQEQNKTFDLIVANSVTGDGTFKKFKSELVERHPQYHDKVIELLYITDIRNSDPGNTISRVCKPLRLQTFYDRLCHLAFGPDDDKKNQQPTAPVTTLPTVDSDQSSENELDYSSCHLLIAEDNPVNQMVAEGILESLGFSTHCVDNGREAIAYLETHDCDLVLMDCQMPVMDGYQATQSIRKRKDELAAMPIIALTANAMTGDYEKCLAAGMDEYLAKPFEPEKLEAMIKKLILASRSGPAGETGAERAA